MAKLHKREMIFVGHLVVRIRSDGVHIVCRSRGDFTVSPVLVSFSEASLLLTELQQANVQEKYSIVNVYAP